MAGRSKCARRSSMSRATRSCRFGADAELHREQGAGRRPVPRHRRMSRSTVSAAHGYTDVPGLLQMARQISLWLHRADDQPRHAAAGLQRSRRSRGPAARPGAACPRAGCDRCRARHAELCRQFRHVGSGQRCRSVDQRLRARFPLSGQGEGLCRAERRAEARRKLAEDRRRRRIPTTTPPAPMRSMCWRAAAR